MIQLIHGPTYCYSGETVVPGTLIYVQDHHYNEQDQCFHLEKLLKNSPGHGPVVFDHVLCHEEFVTDPVYFPTLLARETQEFCQQHIQINWAEKTQAFNFMINKPRPNRKILLELIDQLKLNNFSHSLCWQTSPYKSIPTTQRLIGSEQELEYGVKNGFYKNALTYQRLLQKSVFEPAAVSLITEPGFWEQETIVTEKTLMAIWGGCVPVWVGGWRHADYMRDLGFDVFDDIVDHSYQSLLDPGQRCGRAVLDNMHLLHTPVEVDLGRLQHNLDLARSNPWLNKINNLLEIYPDLRRVWPA